MPDRPRMTAKKTKPKPPQPKTEPKDEPKDEPKEEPADDRRERSRSRDDPPRERSRSRDDSPPPDRGRSVKREDRSRSRDDRDHSPSHQRDGSVKRERSKSRDSSHQRRDSVKKEEKDEGTVKKEEPTDPKEEDDDDPDNEFHDAEGGESETITFDTDVEDFADADMIFDPDLNNEWQYYSEQEKMACRTGHFSHVRDMDGRICSLDNYTPTPSVFQTYFAKGRSTERPDIHPDMQGINEEDKAYLSLCFDARGKLKSGASSTTTARMKKRKEANSDDKRNFKNQFLDAKKAEIKSWIDNDVYELVDIRRLTHEQRKNFVSGRWVLTIKRDMDGKFQKCKARWVLRGFQDRQKHEQQTDSPAASRPGFRMACTAAACHNHDLYHMDLKTAFLQGEAYDDTRNVICQLPKEAGKPWYMVALMKKPAYGLNDAPRRWWNVVDAKLREYGCVPTRADRCTYVLYHDSHQRLKSSATKKAYLSAPPSSISDSIEAAIEYMMDPYHGSNANGRKVAGIVCLHVDDLFMAGDEFFRNTVMSGLRKDFQVGSEDKNDIMFVGQRIRWVNQSASAGSGSYISVDQKVAIEDLEEVKFDKSLKDNVDCSPVMHTAYRSVLGQINWLQSRTQFQACYKFSRAASAAAKPNIGHVRELNKLVRQIKNQPVIMKFWPLKGSLRLIGQPDASYKNNEDKSSQRAHVIFLAEGRNEYSPTRTKGTLVDYESHKITVTTMSTTVAELHALMKCFGTCLFLRGLWADLSGQDAEIHMRTDANNLVTTASTTHAPEQKETIHLIQMLRKESVSGRISDLAHVVSADCLSDSLTKHSAKPDALILAVESGFLPNIDIHPPFRTMLKHKAFLAKWIVGYVDKPGQVLTFLDEDMYHEVYSAMHCD